MGFGFEFELFFAPRWFDGLLILFGLAWLDLIEFDFLVWLFGFGIGSVKRFPALAGLEASLLGANLLNLHSASQNYEGNFASASYTNHLRFIGLESA